MTDDRNDILKGLAWNRAAPDDVLLRLLSPDARAAWSWMCLREGLSQDLVDAIVGHPDLRVRGAFAESWTAAPADRARLADDPEPKVRICVGCGPEPFRFEVAPLPDATYERLLADPDDGVREWTAQSHSLPPRLLARYAGHSDPKVRAAACRAWDQLAPGAREVLLADPDEAVRRAAARKACADDAARTDQLLDTLGSWEREDVLRRGLLTRATAERHVASEEPRQRAAIAWNPSLPPDLIARLASDPEHDVRLAVSARPELNEEQRAAIDYEVLPKDRLRPVGWVWDLRDDLDALRHCATSAHPWLRRTAAANPCLPADLVAPLAHDEDPAVRLLTCEYQPDAPPDALLRTALGWTGYTRSILLERPQFPRKGLARYADDADPGLRVLVPLDPDAAPELIIRLSHDESGWVRRTAAADPRLPPDRIEELLADPAAVDGAARNPALPVAVMRRLLDELGVA
ncbi:hypothetical protein [Streptomyces sp. NPDC005485]|uniref:hypothetical protein n=1 Tax=Streptomyces sp. NPDC005485 TaxID=3155591 RepID=UPI0033B31DB8